MSQTKPPASPIPQAAWSGRFSEPVSNLVKRYTASVFFDRRMWRQDIRASLAHARMLARQGIIAAIDLAAIEQGMATMADEVEAGNFNWNLDDEDVHLNIEKRLTALVGDAGKRLHTGRSRNDQVATDIRLWMRDTIDDIDILLRNLQVAMLTAAETHAETPMPGFTHLQVAQPVSFGHHLLAYFRMLRRDREPLCRLSAPHQPAPSGRRRPGRHHLPHRPRIGGARTWLRRRLREFPGRGFRSGLCNPNSVPPPRYR